ncbi:lasso peptide biosynthesis B2 protein [Erythrobacter tepidarius]|uniref:lasso peptide biosynthesis B2 protein n=1 Tax=Erythrobacter tepidarius TaxID=60454 RepID=UPI000A38E3F8|nr:lasso peptide biosynthesis B2 protein [Erythrobacter tepidarius]
MAYALRGLLELVRARLVFARLAASEIPARNRAVSKLAGQGGGTADPAHLARIAYVLPRLSARLPWRSDCLVQAIAAQNWLAAGGLAGEIQIGVERPADRPFGAHAWLVHQGMVITGGEIGRYERLLGESVLSPQPDEPNSSPATDCDESAKGGKSALG